MRLFLNPCLLLAIASAAFTASNAQASPPSTSSQPGPVLVSGTVPDEATRAGVLERLRQLYGADRVIDQIAVGDVAAPANWSAYVQKLLTPSLKQISRGQVTIDGSAVALRGEVGSESLRLKVASDIAAGLNPTYTVSNGLHVAAAEQNVLDNTLANRTVEFDSGQATLTPLGRGILDEMAAAMQKLGARRIEIIGHTDNQGPRAGNQELSQARAEAVRSYLSTKGIDGGLLAVSGQGPDRPVASNDSAAGRARNRRIEFRIAQ
jgi:OOP family OmpA-OmpF porin